MRVAAVQLNSGGEKAANVSAAERAVRAAAADGAKLVVLPEKWSAIGPRSVLEDAAEGLDGDVARWASGIASELQIDLVAGSISERREEGAKLSNTSLHFGADGERKAVYRKIHMFDVEVDGRVYNESEAERPGEEIVTSATASGLCLGLSICYDLRFPELFRILALRGAEVVALPAAFTLPTTRDHWEVLLRARAIENQCFLIAANQVGEHPSGMRSGGRSMIVDPWGVVLACAADRPGCIVADLDLEMLRDVRRRLPSLANRSPSAYRWPGREGGL